MSKLKSWAFENTESVDVAYQMWLRSASSILGGATGAKDKEILCEQQAKSTSEPRRSQPLHHWQVQVEGKGWGGMHSGRVAEEGWRGCQSTIPLLPCRQIQMSPHLPWLHSPHFSPEIKRWVGEGTKTWICCSRQRKSRPLHRFSSSSVCTVP